VGRRAAVLVLVILGGNVVGLGAAVFLIGALVAGAVAGGRTTRLVWSGR